MSRNVRRRHDNKNDDIRIDEEEDRKLSKRYHNICRDSEEIRERFRPLANKVSDRKGTQQPLIDFSKSVKVDRLKQLGKFLQDCLDARINYYRYSPLHSSPDKGHAHQMDIIQFLIQVINDVISQREFEILGHKENLNINIKEYNTGISNLIEKLKDIEADYLTKSKLSSDEFDEIVTYDSAIKSLLTTLRQVNKKWYDNLESLVDGWYKFYQEKIKNNSVLLEDKNFYQQNIGLFTPQNFSFDEYNPENYNKKNEYIQKELKNQFFNIPYDRVLSQFFVYMWSQMNIIKKYKDQIKCDTLQEKYKKIISNYLIFCEENKIPSDDLPSYIQSINNQITYIKNSRIQSKYKEYINKQNSFNELYNNTYPRLNKLLQYCEEFIWFKNKYNNLCVLLDNLIVSTEIINRDFELYERSRQSSSSSASYLTPIDNIIGKEAGFRSNWADNLLKEAYFTKEICTELSKLIKLIPKEVEKLNENFEYFKEGLIKDAIYKLKNNRMELSLYNISKEIFPYTQYDIGYDPEWRQIISRVKNS